MSEAEHRTRDCAQYHARAKSQSALGTGRNGKGQSDHAKDGNRPGVHDRSPADWSLARFPTCDVPASRQLCRFEPREPSWKSNRPPPWLPDRSVLGAVEDRLRAVSNLSSP